MYYVLTKPNCDHIFFATDSTSSTVEVCSGDSDLGNFTSMVLPRDQARALWKMFLNQGYSEYVQP